MTSRIGAGIGSGIGILVGGVLGTYAGATFHGRMTVDDSMTAVGGIGALLGGVFGAAIGAGSEPKPINAGVSGVGQLRSEWRLP